MDEKTIQRKYKKWIANYNDCDNVQEIVDLFHTNRDKFNKKDIYQYDFNSLIKEIEEKNIYSKRKKKKAEKITGSTVIYQDEIVKIIRLESLAATQQYLKGTKLCITQARHYCHYTFSGSVFHLINLKKNSVLAGSKYIICSKQKTICWNEKNDPLGVTQIINDKGISIITKDVQNYADKIPSKKLLTKLSPDDTQNINAFKEIFHNTKNSYLLENNNISIRTMKKIKNIFGLKTLLNLGNKAITKYSEIGIDPEDMLKVLTNNKTKLEMFVRVIKPNDLKTLLKIKNRQYINREIKHRANRDDKFAKAAMKLNLIPGNEKGTLEDLVKKVKKLENKISNMKKKE